MSPFAFPRRNGSRGHAPLHCLLLAALPSLAGCASYHAMAFTEQRSASTIVEHRQKEGLHVAVRDLSDARTSRKYFARDLTSSGFVPVLVLVELDALSSSAFNIRRDELHLVLRDGTRLKSVDPTQVVDEVAFSHWRTFFGYIFLLPGPFVGSSVSSANQQLEMDYGKKALESVRISPNMRSFRGVLFFRIPDDVRPRFTMEDSFVEFVVYMEGHQRNEGRGTGMGMRMEFPVHFSE